MSVGSGTPFIQHVGNGVTRLFAYPFTLLSAEDLTVTVDDVLTTAYTVAGIGSAVGGSVTFDTAPANGAQVFLRREVPLVRATDYQTNGDLQADTVNDDFDRLWMAMQQVGSDASRALRVPEVSGVDEIPAATLRAGRLLGFDTIAGAPEASAFTQGQVAAAIAALSPNGTSGTIILRELHVATAGQTVFTLANEYTPGVNGLFVIVDDAPLPALVDYAETNSNTVTFGTGLLAGQEVEFIIGRLVTSGVEAAQVSHLDVNAAAVAMSQAQVNAERLTSKRFGISSAKTASYNRGALQEAVDSGLGRLDMIANYTGETFTIDGPIDVPNFMEIEGINRWGCNISSTNLDEPIFRYSSSNTRNALRGLNLSYAGTPTAGANAIECNGNSEMDIHRVTIASCWNGVYMYGGVSGQAGNHEMIGLRVFSYESSGVFLDGCIDVNLTNFRMHAFARPGVLGGIRLLGAVEAFTAAQGDITLGKYGMTADTNGAGGRGNSPYFNRFFGVFFDSPLENPAYLRHIGHTDFFGCWFASGGHDPGDTGYTAMTDHAGVDIENARHVRFIGGDIYGNGGNGANVYAGNQHITFDGVGIKRNGRWRSADRAGVNVLAGTTDFAVRNCTFERDADTTEYRQRTSVNVNTGASDIYVISGNTLGGCNLIDDGTGVDKSVTGNVGAA